MDSMGILWIFGAIIILGILFGKLNHYFEGMVVGIWLANFLCWAGLISIIFVWALNMGISSRDFRYLEGCLQDQESGVEITNPKFIELYLQYKGEREYWINRQFHAKASQELVDIFNTGHTAFHTTEN